MGYNLIFHVVRYISNDFFGSWWWFAHPLKTKNLRQHRQHPRKDDYARYFNSMKLKEQHRGGLICLSFFRFSSGELDGRPLFLRGILPQNILSCCNDKVLVTTDKTFTRAIVRTKIRAKLSLFWNLTTEMIYFEATSKQVICQKRSDVFSNRNGTSAQHLRSSSFLPVIVAWSKCLFRKWKVPATKMMSLQDIWVKSTAVLTYASRHVPPKGSPACFCFGMIILSTSAQLQHTIFLSNLNDIGGETNRICAWQKRQNYHSPLRNTYQWLSKPVMLLFARPQVKKQILDTTWMVGKYPWSRCIQSLGWPKEICSTVGTSKAKYNEY